MLEDDGQDAELKWEGEAEGTEGCGEVGEGEGVCSARFFLFNVRRGAALGQAVVEKLSDSEVALVRSVAVRKEK